MHTSTVIQAFAYKPHSFMHKFTAIQTFAYKTPSFMHTSTVIQAFAYKTHLFMNLSRVILTFAIKLTNFIDPSTLTNNMLINLLMHQPILVQTFSDKLTSLQSTQNFSLNLTKLPPFMEWVLFKYFVIFNIDFSLNLTVFTSTLERVY